MTLGREALLFALWIVGIVLFLLLFPINTYLITEVAPHGIASHRSATSAIYVTEIQRSWHLAGLYWVAQINLIIDYLFILSFSSSGLLLSLFIARNTGPSSLAVLAWISALAHLLFAMADLLETSAQFAQLMTMHGSNSAISVIHFVRHITIAAFLISIIAMPILLVFRITFWRQIRRQNLPPL